MLLRQGIGELTIPITHGLATGKPCGSFDCKEIIVLRRLAWAKVGPHDEKFVEPIQAAHYFWVERTFAAVINYVALEELTPFGLE